MPSGPPRLPRELVLPETSLWFNLEVSGAALPEQAGLPVLRPRADASPSCTARPRRWPAGCRRTAWPRATACCCSCRTARSTSIAFYAILRADAVVVPVNPMNRADEFGHYITDSGGRAWRSPAPTWPASWPQADARAARRAAAAAPAGHARSPTRCPSGALDPAEAPAPAMLALAARRRRRCPPRCTPLGRRAGRRPRARAAHGATRRPGAAALHLGHHRAAQGLHAHATAR